jgi:predicted nucleotidyltransferase
MLQKAALQELKSVLMMKYSDYIDRIILFGSQLSGNAKKWSDYDILLIVKRPYDWRFENQVYDTCVDINVKYDLIIDIKIISKEELKTLKGKQPFIQNALTYGVTV